MKPKLFWQGQSLASRIWVCNANSRCLYHIPPPVALRLLRSGIVFAEKGDQKIHKVFLCFIPGTPWKPPHKYGPRDYASKPLVTIVKLGPKEAFAGARVQQFIPIPKQDAWAYRLSVTENLRA